MKRARHILKLNRAGAAPVEGHDRNVLRTTQAGTSLQLAQQEAGKPARLNIVAYTGDAITQWWSDVPLVVDLASVKLKGGKRPLLFSHDPTQPVGHVESWDNNGRELRASAVLSGAGPRTEEIAASLGRGMPWQASIGGPAGTFEFVKRGETVQVNGRQFDGPIRVVRKAEIVELSVVTLGADDNTSTTLAANKGGRSTGGGAMKTFKEWLIEAGYGEYETLSKETLKAARAIYNRLKASSDQGDGNAEGEDGAGADDAGGDDAEGADNTGEDAGNDGDEDEGGREGGPGGTKPPAAAQGRVNASRQGPSDMVRAHREQIAAEQRRIAKVNKILAAHPDLAEKAVRLGWSPTKATLAAMRAERKAPAAHAFGGMAAGEQDQVMRAGLLMAGSVKAQTLLEREQYSDKVLELAAKRGPKSLGEVMHMVCQQAGVYCRAGRVTAETIRAAFEASRKLEAAASTISLPNILADVQNKVLIPSFLAVDDVLSRICAINSNPDFKTGNRLRLTASGELEQVGANGELKNIELEDEGYTNRVRTRGALLGIGREMLINDDASALLQVPALLGRKAALSLQKVGWTKFLASLGTLFTAGNKNYISGGTTTLSIASLTQLEQKFLDQVDKVGDPISLSPKFLLTGSALKTDAMVLMKETRVNETTTADKKSPAMNPHAGKWEPLATPWINNTALTGNTATAFWLLADPEVLALMVITYYNNQRNPVIESGAMDFANLGIQTRVVFDFGVDTEDYRAGAMSKGAA